MLDLVLAVLIDELLVVCNERLGDGLTDGVDLRCVSTSGNADADIDVLELVETGDQERLVDLESEDLWLDEVEGLSVHLDESFTGLFPILSVFRPVVYRLSPDISSSRVERIESYLAVGDGGGYRNTVSMPQISQKINSLVPVFFLPKHCTLWVVEAIFAFIVCRRSSSSR